ncbi:MAG TPA: hypothetical protein DCY18_08575 [Thauera sp.]|nr:hypothetical protein [Thauera sp.]
MTPTVEHKCLTCRFAEWVRTDAGRLHPSGQGRCTWVGVLPRSRSYPFSYRDDPPTGGFIERRPKTLVFLDCPTYEPAEDKRR